MARNQAFTQNYGIIPDKWAIRLFREQKWTQEGFAERCGLGIRTCQNIENPNTAGRFNLDTLRTVAEVLKLDYRELILESKIIEDELPGVVLDGRRLNAALKAKGISKIALAIRAHHPPRFVDYACDGKVIPKTVGETFVRVLNDNSLIVRQDKPFVIPQEGIENQQSVPSLLTTQPATRKLPQVKESNPAGDSLPFLLSAAAFKEVHENLRPESLMDLSELDVVLAEYQQTTGTHNVKSLHGHLGGTLKQISKEIVMLDDVITDSDLQHLKIATIGTSISTLAVLRYIQITSPELRLRIDYNFILARDLASKLSGKSVDIAILPTAAAVRFVADGGLNKFTPIYNMPTGTDSIIAPRGKGQTPEYYRSGLYALTNSAPLTTSTVFLSSLLNSGAIDTRNITVERNWRPTSLFQALLSGENLKTMLWFPHDAFATIFLNCQKLFTRRSGYVLFAHNSLMTQHRRLALLHKLIYNAQHDLLRHSHKIHGAVQNIFSDDDYIAYLKRGSGVLQAAGITE